MSDIEGFILTGGASSRMGRDKGLLRLGGRAFVECVADALAPLCRTVSVVSSRHGAELLGLPVVEDVYASRGALGGLHAALRHSRSDWVAIVSCDLPFVTAELLGRLASLRGVEADAVAPVQADGRVQPLCALYRPSACLAPAEAMLAEGELRPRVLLERVRARLVSFGELSDLEGSLSLFENVNTQEDYERALRHAACGRV